MRNADISIRIRNELEKSKDNLDNSAKTVMSGLSSKFRGVIKRCCLSWLTNSALVYESKCGGMGSCGVSANEYSCVHHVTWSPNKLWRSNSIFNLRLNLTTLLRPSSFTYYLMISLQLGFQNCTSQDLVCVLCTQ